MLPELILREEEDGNLPLLAVLGLVSGIAGFIAARQLFPSEADIIAVLFASIPLVFPLMAYFLEREADSRPHLPEIKVYSAIFVGEAAAFFLLGLYFPGAFEIQSQLIGAVGNAVSPVSFAAVLQNNLTVFLGILIVASIIGSAGAFILTWNASLLGVFFASLVQESPVTPFAYVPHASLEMGGFIVAGVAGTMISAAVYREHFERETWLDLAKLVLSGVALIVAAAVLETA